MKKISQFLDGVRSKCSALWSKLYVRLIVLALLFIFPHVVPNQYVVYIGVIVMHLGIEILGYNFITGYGNTFTMGQAAFCGLGAYFSVYISMHTSIPVTVCIILGGFFAALCGLIISLPTQKLRITFLSLATMGLNQLLYIIFKNAEPLTGGTYGTKDIPRPVLFGSAMSNNWYFDYTLIFLILSIVVIERILMSKSDRVVLALAVDPTVASAMGVDIRKYRTLMFSIAAFFGGIGGALQAHFINYVHPDTYKPDETMMLIAMMALGGMASIAGSIVGPGIFTVISLYFAQLYDYRTIICGLLLIFTMLYRPSGLMGGKRLPLRKSSLAFIQNREQRSNVPPATAQQSQQQQV